MVPGCAPPWASAGHDSQCADFSPAFISTPKTQKAFQVSKIGLPLAKKLHHHPQGRGSETERSLKNGITAKEALFSTR
jgi:hypothetical protein